MLIYKFAAFPLLILEIKVSAPHICVITKV